MTTSTALPSERDPDARVRCADWARDASLSPVGTIGTPAGYLLVEIPLPWPRDAGETAEGAALGPLLRPHRYRLQAIAPASSPDDSAARPQDRRVILHAKPPGAAGFAGYRRFEAAAGESLTDTVAALIAAANSSTAADGEPSPFEAPGTDLLLCTHGSRDSCCGRLGASLAVRLAGQQAQPGALDGVSLWRTSHTGGHRFAPTFIVLPQGTAWGFADQDVVTRVLRQDGDFAAVAGHYRGCTGLDGPQVQALEAAVLGQVGWRLLGLARSGAADGPRTRLTWRDGDQEISYEAEVRPGRSIPMPGCMTPASSAVKRETEWDVAAVRRVLRNAGPARLDYQEELVSISSVSVGKLFIDGQLVDAEGGATYDNINPATETSLGPAADGSAGDIDRAIGAARRAFDQTRWSTDVAFRVHCLRQLQEGLAKYSAELKELTTAEVGIPVQLTDSTVDGPIEGVGWVTDLLENYAFSQDYGNGDLAGFASHRWVEREPFGVVGAITPWNQPLQVNLAKVGPALAAGNAVVLKAAPTTPWSATVIAKVVAEHTDIPAGIFNVITSNTNNRGEELITHPRVDLISFTGSTAIGRRIMKLGSDTVKKCFLELGGKSPNIVLEDADFARGIMMSTFMVCLHGGQGCATLSRLLLPASRFDEGVEIAKQQLSSMGYGDPTVMGNIMGPLNSAQHRDRVAGMVERAKEAGHQPLLGGRRPPELATGYYYEPTLFADLPEDAELVKSEIFGPVLVIQKFTDDEDAIRIANDTIFGLSGAVFSGDHERSKALARRVRAGTMIVDGGIYYGHNVPFGGYKQSGIGRETGQLGFEEYLQVKALSEPI